MLRVLAMFSCILAATPAVSAPFTADPATQLEVPGVSIALEKADTQVTASYVWHDGLMDLTVMITDPDGDNLRTRIGMRDGQRHTLLVPATQDWAPSTRIDFRRIGGRIEMHVDDASFQSFLAAR